MNLVPLGDRRQEDRSVLVDQRRVGDRRQTDRHLGRIARASTASTVKVTLRLTPTERARAHAVAALNGKDLSAWMRDLMDEAALQCSDAPICDHLEPPSLPRT